MQPLYLHRLCLCKFRSLNRQVLTSGRVLGIVRKPPLLSHGQTSRGRPGDDRLQYRDATLRRPRSLRRTSRYFVMHSCRSFPRHVRRVTSHTG